MGKAPLIGTPEWLADLVRRGVRLGDCGKMCADCAFRLNQPRDLSYLQAVEDATFQLAWDGRFHCHTAERSDAGRPCAGFAYARQGLQDLENQ